MRWFLCEYIMSESLHWEPSPNPLHHPSERRIHYISPPRIISLRHDIFANDCWKSLFCLGNALLKPALPRFIVVYIMTACYNTLPSKTPTQGMRNSTPYFFDPCFTLFHRTQSVCMLSGLCAHSIVLHLEKKTRKTWNNKYLRQNPTQVHFLNSDEDIWALVLF